MTTEVLDTAGYYRSASSKMAANPIETCGT